jgi:hypothetical protein
MRDFLLSIAAPETLIWIGFILLAAGLLGEVAVLTAPFETHWTHKPVGFTCAAIVLVGYVIGHIGDDAMASRFERRATDAEKALNELKLSGVPKPPRTLSDSQQTKIAEEIRPWAGQLSTFNVAQDTNSISLLRLLRKTVEMGGWKLGGSQIGDIEMDGAGVVIGIGVEIQVHPDSAHGTTMAGAANALASALAEVGIAAKAVVNPSLKKAEAINIVVGERP